MKIGKKLIAAAIGGVVAAPGMALAQAPSAGVQLYGGIDTSLNNFRLSDGGAADVKKNVFYSSGLRTIFGIRGQEPLGRGLTAWFQLESTVAGTGRINPQIQPGFQLGGRNSAAGLRGGWGDVLVGQWDMPYKVNTFPIIVPTTQGMGSVYGSILGNPNGAGNADTTGTEPQLVCANPTLAGANPAITCTMTEGSPTSFVRRASNVLQYWSPVMGGFQARIGTQFSDAVKVPGVTGDRESEIWSASLSWTGGPITVGAGYETHRDFQFDGGKDNGYSLMATYKLGAATLGGYFERLDTDGPAPGAEIEATNWAVMALFDTGTGQVTAVYGAARDPEGAGAAADAGGKSWTVGYRHFLSKRTNVYAYFSQLENDAGSTRAFLSQPVNGLGTAGVVAGQDVRVLGVGLNLTF